MLLRLIATIVWRLRYWTCASLAWRAGHPHWSLGAIDYLRVLLFLVALAEYHPLLFYLVFNLLIILVIIHPPFLPRSWLLSVERTETCFNVAFECDKRREGPCLFYVYVEAESESLVLRVSRCLRESVPCAYNDDFDRMRKTVRWRRGGMDLGMDSKVCFR